MRAGTQGDAINPWGVRCSGRCRTVQPQTATQQSAYDKWLDQTSAREEARRDRIHGAVGVIPMTLWIVLFFIAGVIFVFMLFFADSGERAVVQGVLMGSVVSVMVALLLLLHSLDDPFHDGVGGLQAGRDGAVVADHRRGAGRGRREGAAPCDARRKPAAVMTAPGAGRDSVELVATVLLALATVATAWSGYQASRWNGEQAKAGARASATRIESAKASGLANTQTEIDVATFTSWVNAYAQKQTELAEFYFERFRKEFKPAVDAWIATRPLKNPNAPLTPFAMPQYHLQARAEAERLERRRGVGRRGAAGHSALVELRARCRPVCVGVVLRGHEHQAEDAKAAHRDARRRLRGLPRHRRLDRRRLSASRSDGTSDGARWCSPLRRRLVRQALGEHDRKEREQRHGEHRLLQCLELSVGVVGRDGVGVAAAQAPAEIAAAFACSVVTISIPCSVARLDLRAHARRERRVLGDAVVKPVSRPVSRTEPMRAVPSEAPRFCAVPWRPPASFVFSGGADGHDHVAELGHQQACADAEQRERELERESRSVRRRSCRRDERCDHHRERGRSARRASARAGRRASGRQRRDEHRHRHRQQPFPGLERVEAEHDLQVDGKDEEGAHQHELLRHQRRQAGAQRRDLQQCAGRAACPGEALAALLPQAEEPEQEERRRRSGTAPPRSRTG